MSSSSMKPTNSEDYQPDVCSGLNPEAKAWFPPTLRQLETHCRDGQLPLTAEGWVGLGNTLLAQASRMEEGRMLRKKALECISQALRLDPQYARGWNALGRAIDGPAWINGKSYDTKEACYEKALEVDPLCWQALANLGAVYSLTNQNKALRYYLLALEINPDHAALWSRVGQVMDHWGNWGSSAKDITFRDQAYSKLGCFVAAVRLESTNSKHWISLGDRLRSGGIVRVEGQLFSRRTCRLRALRLDPKYSKGV